MKGISFLFKKQFHGAFSYLIAFGVIVIFSMLVDRYAYVHAKQKQLQADLRVAGQVTANTLCISGVCKSVWPIELLNTDVVAGGAVRNWVVSTACNAPSSGGRCDAYFYYYYPTYARTNWSDPRGVLTDSYSQASMPCYNTPNGSSSACGTLRTYPSSQSFSCSNGFVADQSNAIASSISDGCYRWCSNCGCTAAVCRLP